ncbi:hypothetical protein CHU92_10500 [Flavobacterium cyanobacteriorum]|uniref:RES domain-containing protein n=1 Tax=Flavobacterium cyanobacteriorum TaxID=2022802 RepID=A0A255Z4C5_9FLAO|nr:hypothetical protein [Flavobacterium cyanobacteriorum]OYQ32977.1 hypothetical protein CHU92_13730 [Flavobacterium cyanobacteriorum]OYQ35735.1 hypothetical protein CHU92_10500 [Flavobacterium cyanobacteriorum]
MNNKFDLIELQHFLTLLKNAKESQSIESYIYIKNILNTIEFPIPCVIFPKGTKLVRTRVHRDNEDFFSSVGELSYRKDIQNIKFFGRANEPGQSTFYCANDDSISIPETSEIIRQNIDKEYEYLTTGLWIAKENLLCVSLLTNDDIKDQHKELEEISKSFSNLAKE